MKKYESPLCETILLEEKEIISTSIEPPFIDGDDLFEMGYNNFLARKLLTKFAHSGK